MNSTKTSELDLASQASHPSSTLSGRASPRAGPHHKLLEKNPNVIFGENVPLPPDISQPAEEVAAEVPEKLIQNRKFL
jgi:hypothetical protein